MESFLPHCLWFVGPSLRDGLAFLPGAEQRAYVKPHRHLI